MTAAQRTLRLLQDAENSWMTALIKCMLSPQMNNDSGIFRQFI